MKKRILLFIACIFFILLMTLSVFILKEKKLNPKNKIKLSEKIEKEIEKESNLLIFISEDKEGSMEEQKIINFYEKEYNLKFTIIYKNQYKEKELLELLEKLEIRSDDVMDTSLIIIKNKKAMGIVNDFINENVIRNFFIQYEFINEDTSDIDNILTLEEFDEKLKSNEKTLLLLYSGDSISHKNRKILLNMSQKYKFQYNIINSSVSFGYTMYETLRNKIGKPITIPALVIIQNNEVIAHTSTFNEKEILQFLKKNYF